MKYSGRGGNVIFREGGVRGEIWFSDRCKDPCGNGTSIPTWNMLNIKGAVQSRQILDIILRSIIKIRSFVLERLRFLNFLFIS
jgi:hypothetical protein